MPADAQLPAHHADRQVTGAIWVSGAPNLYGFLRCWARTFSRMHPAAQVRLDPSTRLTSEGVHALLAGRAQIVACARELFPAESARLEARFGHAPLMVCVALGSYDTPHNTDAIAVYVNAANPLRRLTLAQLDAIYSSTRRRGYSKDISTWGQLGLTGAWARRPIHLYGMLRRRASGNPPGIVNFLERRLLEGGRFKPGVREEQGHDGVAALDAIVAAVAADPAGIGYSGFANARPGVKAVNLTASPGGRYYAGTPANVAADAYPLTRRVYLCVAWPSGHSLPPLLDAFLEYALSCAGQAAVAADSSGYLPLPATEAALQRARVDSLASSGARAPQSPRRPGRNTDVAGALPAPPAVDPGLPRYVARAVTVPEHARYVTKTGAVAIIGYNDMRDILQRMDALFVRTHPGVTFALDLPGTRAAPPALAHGRSLLAPMGAELLPDQLAAYLKIAGAPPVDFRIAHASPRPRAKSGPIGVFVARGNPLRRLTTAQVARVFAGGAGAITTWGQLGLTGPWANRPINPYGLSERTALGVYMERHHFHDRPLVPDFVGLSESTDVVSRVGRDPLGIGFAAANRANPQVRLLAIASAAGGYYARASTADLQADRYPYDRYLHLYARRTPAGGLDPLACEYLRLALSREGQEAIAADPRGYIPLNAADAARERTKLRLSPAR